MDRVMIIAAKDIKEALHSKVIYIYMLFLFLLSMSYFSSFRNVIGSLSEQGLSLLEIRFAGRAFLNGVYYTLPLVLSMLICGIFSAYAVILDKTKRTLESLLATPVSLREVWLGKSLAVALPGVAVALLVSSLALGAMNILIVMPSVGDFILPDMLPMITAHVIIPLLTFLVVTLVSLLQLITRNPRLANLTFTAVFLVIYFSTITELTASWDFSLIYLVVAALLAAVIFYLSRFLTRERVILSSR
ncbi:MAG: ABC transporter permease subunit [Chloroflexota bacterium]